MLEHVPHWLGERMRSLRAGGVLVGVYERK